jgi:hypothetical protein
VKSGKILHGEAPAGDLRGSASRNGNRCQRGAIRTLFSEIDPRTVREQRSAFVVAIAGQGGGNSTTGAEEQVESVGPSALPGQAKRLAPVPG